MTNFEVFAWIVILLIIVVGGVLIYLGVAGTFIIYALGANESPKGRRIFLGVLGVAMVIALILSVAMVNKYGWPL